MEKYAADIFKEPDTMINQDEMLSYLLDLEVIRMCIETKPRKWTY